MKMLRLMSVFTCGDLDLSDGILWRRIFHIGGEVLVLVEVRVFCTRLLGLAGGRGGLGSSLAATSSPSSLWSANGRS